MTVFPRISEDYAKSTGILLGFVQIIQKNKRNLQLATFPCSERPETRTNRKGTFFPVDMDTQNFF